MVNCEIQQRKTTSRYKTATGCAAPRSGRTSKYQSTSTGCAPTFVQESCCDKPSRPNKYSELVVCKPDPCLRPPAPAPLVPLPIPISEHLPDLYYYTGTTPGIVTGADYLDLPENWKGKRIRVFRNKLLFTEYTRTENGISLLEGDVWLYDGPGLSEQIVIQNY